MNKKIFILIFVVLFAVYISLLNFQGFNLDAFFQANVLYLGAALLTLLVVLAFRSIKYWLLLRNFDIKTGKEIYLITNFGYFSNFISPIRISELARSFVLKRKTKKSFFRILSPTVFDSLIDIVTLLFIVVFFSAFVTLAFDYTSKLITVSIFAVIIVVVLWMISTRKGEKLSLKLLNIFSSRIFKRDIKKGSKEFIKCSRQLMGNKKLLISTFFIEIFVWFLEGLKLFFMALAFGVPVPYFTCILIISLAYLIGGSFVNPSGMTQEMVLLLLLTQLPFDKGQLVLVGSLDAIISVGTVCVLGTFFLMKFGVENLKIEKVQT